MKNKLNPITAKLATPRPITVPPEKETFRASGRLVLAASAVRELEAVAIHIPILPAKAENIAPKINAGTIIQLVVETIIDIPKSATDATTTKINNNLYSALRNARAPSWMAFEISFILSLPADCFFTQADLITIITKPITAQIGAIYITF